MVKLVERRHFEPREFRFETLREAVDDALGQLEFDAAYPNYIEVDGVRVWESPGPGKVSESLRHLVGISEEL